MKHATVFPVELTISKKPVCFIKVEFHLTRHNCLRVCHCICSSSVL